MKEDNRVNPVSGRIVLSDNSTMNYADWYKQQREFSVGWNIANNGAVRMSRTIQSVDQDVFYVGFRVAANKRLVIPSFNVIMSENKYTVSIVRDTDGFTTDGNSLLFYKSAFLEKEDLSVDVQSDAWLNVTPNGTPEVLQETTFVVQCEAYIAPPAPNPAPVVRLTFPCEVTPALPPGEPPRYAPKPPSTPAPTELLFKSFPQYGAFISHILFAVIPPPIPIPILLHVDFNIHVSPVSQFFILLIISDLP